jgi:predicted helicase
MPAVLRGVDVPTLDGVAFIDPGARRDIVYVGGAIRKSGATVGTIVIPVFIDTDTDPKSL